MTLSRRAVAPDLSSLDPPAVHGASAALDPPSPGRAPWTHTGVGNSFLLNQYGLGGASPTTEREAFPFQAEVEAAFGRDLSHLHVRRGEDGRLGTLGAKAAEVGGEVLLGSGHPTREVVFHEVAHALQRERFGGAMDDGLPRFSAPGDSSEREAEEVARRGARGLPVTVRSRPTGVVSRIEEPSLDVSNEEEDQEKAGQDGAAEGPQTDWDICPYGGIYVPQDVAALVKEALNEEDWGALNSAVGSYYLQNALAEKVFPALDEAEQKTLQAAVDVSDSAIFYLEAAAMRLGVALGYRPTTGLRKNAEEGTMEPVAEEQEGMADEDPDVCIDLVMGWVAKVEDANVGLFGSLDAVDAEQVSMDVDLQHERIRNSFHMLFTSLEALATRSAIARVTNSAEELAARLEAMPGLLENVTDGLGKLAAREGLKELFSMGVSSLVGVGELKLAYRLLRAGVVVSANYVGGEVLEMVIDAVPDMDVAGGGPLQTVSKGAKAVKTPISFIKEISKSRTVVRLSKVLKFIGRGGDASKVILYAIADDQQREALSLRLVMLQNDVAILTESLAASAARYNDLMLEETELAKVDRLGFKGSFLDPEAKHLQHRLAVAPDLATPTGEQ